MTVTFHKYKKPRSYGDDFSVWHSFAIRRVGPLNAQNVIGRCFDASRPWLVRLHIDEIVHTGYGWNKDLHKHEAHTGISRTLRVSMSVYIPPKGRLLPPPTREKIQP